MKRFRLQFIAMALPLVAFMAPQSVRAEATPLGVQPAPAASATAPGASAQTAESLKVEILDIEGDVAVQKNSAGDFIDAKGMKTLSGGDSIRAEEGSCKLVIDGKTTIDVWPHTVLKITTALRERIPARKQKTEISLFSGQIRAKLTKLKSDAVFEVSTPTAIAAVRGTTLFLKQGIFDGQPGSQLYVDETSHGVDFTNRASKKTFLVPAFSMSRALGDGSLDLPTLLNKEERENFIRNWNNNSGAPAQQFGVEEAPLNNPGALPPPAPESLKEPLLNEAVLDHLAEQNIPGVNGLPPVGGVAPGFAPKNPPEEENPPAGGGSGQENPPPTEEPTPSEILDQQERQMIRQEIGLLMGDQDFDRADAHLAEIADSQTGKVFTDVHGNRVRVNQYIFMESVGEQNYVELLSLTARTGEYQHGVSALQFLTFFNRSIQPSDGPLKDLPWNDWMRVVTDNQLTFPEQPQAGDAEYIVHEHYSNSEVGPDLYPTTLMAIFSNPISDASTSGAVAVVEAFGAPEYLNADQGNFWIQQLYIRSIAAAGNGTPTLAVVETPFFQDYGQVNGSTVSLENFSGAQTARLATDPRLGQLETSAGFEAFQDSSIHPAFFQNILNGDQVLMGIFLPINDSGQVIDAPGFDVRGLRDLVFPNSAVNGGQYNLETIFLVGSLSGDSFTESFRIDTIITPEIFSSYGLKNPDGSRDTSTQFPSFLNDQQNV